MANWGQPSDETLKLVDEVLAKTNLENFINFKVILNDDQKIEVVKVKKIAPEMKFILGDDVLIIINEMILDQLPVPQQLMCIEEKLSGISFDPENDKLTINQPDVKTHSGFLEKYTYERFHVMDESIKSLYDKEKEDKEQNKQ